MPRRVRCLKFPDPSRQALALLLLYNCPKLPRHHASRRGFQQRSAAQCCVHPYDASPNAPHCFSAPGSPPPKRFSSLAKRWLTMGGCPRFTPPALSTPRRSRAGEFPPVVSTPVFVCGRRFSGEHTMVFRVVISGRQWTLRLSRRPAHHRGSAAILGTCRPKPKGLIWGGPPVPLVDTPYYIKGVQGSSRRLRTSHPLANGFLPWRRSHSVCLPPRVRCRGRRFMRESKGPTRVEDTHT